MTFSHRFHPSVLREYDIRGIVGKTLHAEDAYAIGRCFGSVVARAGEHEVAVGYDGRLSSPMLEEALVKGLLACGLAVIRVGRGPTPQLYFAATTLKTGGAVMITGSHNPADYNGFKLMLQGKPFFGPDIARIGTLAAAGDVVPEKAGNAFTRDVSQDYIDRIVADWDGGARKLRVVWDNGNGAAGDILPRLLKRLPGEHTLMFREVDGHFPNHHPDPTIPANLQALVDEVRARRADIGIAFDGDADRIGVVDDQGTILFGDQFLIILARDVLKAHPGATIISEVKGSQVLFDEIARAGGKPLMFKTGHSLIKAKMAETGSPLAGEMSGHVFFNDHWFGFDDALYAAVRLLGIVARMSTPLSAVRAALPQVLNTPELRFDCAEDRKFAVISEVTARLKAAGAEVNDIDGVRVKTADGWWLLRASNTQAVLVARAESPTAAGLERLKAALGTQLQASGLAAPNFACASAGH